MGQSTRGLATKVAANRLVLLLVVTIAVAWAFVPAFGTALNLSQMLTQMSINGVMVIGMSFLLIAGGVDLAIGSTLAMSGVVYALAASQGIPVALALAVASGAAVGVANGLLVVVGRINFFIATLATMVAVRGIALTLSSGQTVDGTAPGFTWIGSASVTIGPVELAAPAIIFLGVALVGAVVLRWTQIGRNFFAIGGNRQASFLAGVAVDRSFFQAFVIMGALAGLAGALLAARLSSASPAIGTDTPLVVIAAAVLGGTSIYGGVGSIGGSVLGLIFLSVINNALLLLAVPAFYDFVITGGVLIVVVVIDAQLALRRSRQSLAVVGEHPDLTGGAQLASESLAGDTAP